MAADVDYENDLYGILNEVADDWESDVLEALALRSGFLWMCERSWVNRYDEQNCGECGRPRTDCEREEPADG